MAPQPEGLSGEAERCRGCLCTRRLAGRAGGGSPCRTQRRSPEAEEALQTADATAVSRVRRELNQAEQQIRPRIPTDRSQRSLTSARPAARPACSRSRLRCWRRTCGWPPNGRLRWKSWSSVWRRPRPGSRRRLPARKAQQALKQALRWSGRAQKRATELRVRREAPQQLQHKVQAQAVGRMAAQAPSRGLPCGSASTWKQVELAVEAVLRERSRPPPRMKVTPRWQPWLRAVGAVSFLLLAPTATTAAARTPLQEIRRCAIWCGPKAGWSRCRQRGVGVHVVQDMAEWFDCYRDTLDFSGCLLVSREGRLLDRHALAHYARMPGPMVCI